MNLELLAAMGLLLNYHNKSLSMMIDFCDREIAASEQREKELDVLLKGESCLELPVLSDVLS